MLNQKPQRVCCNVEGLHPMHVCHMHVGTILEHQLQS